MVVGARRPYGPTHISLEELEIEMERKARRQEYDRTPRGPGLGRVDGIVRHAVES